MRAELRLFKKQNKDEEARKKRFKVKIAGDGASMTRNLSIEIFSFGLLDWGKSCLSPSRVRIVSAVVGQEDYETLQEGMRDVFVEVNRLLAEKSIVVDGSKLDLEISLCGDMKF